MKQKRKKPKFVRKDAHKKKRLKMKWRKPKGLQNKKRLGLRGYGKKVSIGYGTKKSEKHLSKDGLRIMRVQNVKELKSINKNTDAVLIAAVGTKKKLEIMQAAEKEGIKIINLKEVKKSIEKRKEDMKKRKEMKEAKKKKKKIEEKEEKSLEKKVEKEESEEEKRKLEKKEKDKVLTKKL
ncbi:50S ribosomal protein L32e [Candidatus Woesearchaeota archaeon]|nr:MAG: 50S ribosomal protein L32e [Candidatus Woesearchaeota archaeon]